MAELRVRELDEGPFVASVLEAVDQIPPGKVASHDDIAEALGYPEGGRLVGWVLQRPARATVPWHRVVSNDGSLGLSGPGSDTEQANLLRSEGVEVSTGEKVDRDRYGWRPLPRVHRSGPVVSLR